MASINFISGNILKADLVRGGNLAFSSNTSSNLLYFDNVNNLIGIKTNAPTSDFQINGVLAVGNVSISNVGNVNGGNVWINNINDPIQNQDVATKKYVDSSAGNITTAGNLTFSNTTISTSLITGNITLKPTGTALTIIDTTTGLVVPVGNTAQQPGSPAQGTVRFNTDYLRLEVYDGAEWDSVAAGVTNETFYGNGVQTNFTMSRSSTTAATLVMLNGVVQLPTTAYIVTGNLLSFTQAPTVSDTIDVRFL